MVTSSQATSRRRLSHEVIGVFSARIVWMVFGSLCGIILARWLGPHDRGLFALILLLPATSLTVVKFGISQANVYFINRERIAAELVAANAVFLAITSGLVSGAVVWLLRDTLQNTVLKGVPEWAIGLAVSRIPLLLVDDYLYGVLQATGRFRLYNFRLVVSEAIRLVLLVVTLVIMNGGLFAAVAVQTSMTVLNVTWLVWSTRKVIPFGLRMDRALLLKQMRFGVKSYVQTMTSHLLFRADLFLVSYFLGPVQTAFYSLSQRFPELLLELPQAVGLVLYPRLASMPESEMHELTAQACRRTLLLLVPAAIVLVLSGRLLIWIWYGSAFLAAAEPLPLVTVGIVSITLYLIVTRNFTSRNMQQVNTAVGVVALLINFTLNLYAIPRFGILGAAGSLSIAYTVACALLLLLFLRDSRLPLTKLVIPDTEDFRFMWALAARVYERSRRFAGGRELRERPIKEVS